ncbi:hypothetical protein Clacol_002861 [Clathrus columnatus]|uniref:Enoyl reductase (ER) domain-containing protein n=1 Tax=Clathrus columnatus TaxID=1419009 RepID=A0AAV5A1Y6_9AGAM|nr:hypothetical protein Clacol_002861 [Clathrus columnatus]
MSIQTLEIRLSERPTGHVNSKTFVSESISLSTTLSSSSGHVLVQVDWLSIDPAMRGWLDDKRSYLKPVQIGEKMRAQGLGTVIKSSSKTIKVGDIVRGTFGWCTYAIMAEKDVEPLSLFPGVHELDFLGILGLPGLTAYFGLFDIAQIKQGETLVVSGAAGAVGSVACQLGKLKGAKVIALAGSDDKVEWLESDLGVHKALNYKSPTFIKDFKAAVGYLDVYFDNVGGRILDLCLTRLKKNARVVLCGAISDYISITPGAKRFTMYPDQKPQGLQAYLNLISQTAKIQGFLVFDYASKFDGVIREMNQWISENKLKRRFHIVEGLEKCPESMNMLFTGANIGKLVVKVSAKVSPKL